VYDVGICPWLCNLTQELIIKEVNPDREAMGFLPLKKSEKLTRAAQLKAKDMIARNYFSHVGPDGQKPWAWIDLVGYRYATVGENLAIDFSDPSVLEKAWLASPSHAKNIMNGYFTDIGVGIADGKMDGKNTTVVVMFLGREITPTLEKVLGEEIEQEPTVRKSESLVVTPEAELATTPPQEPVITKTVEEESLDKEDSLILGLEEQPTFVTSRLETTNLQLFLLRQGSQIIRIALTFFFAFLIVCVLFFTVQKRVNYYFATSRILILGSLLVLLWFPGAALFLFT